MSLLVAAGEDALDLNGSNRHADSEAQNGDNATNDTAKKVRNLQKKLKQIQQLKDKQSTQALTPEQIQKLASEQCILAEIQQLGHNE